MAEKVVLMALMKYLYVIKMNVGEKDGGFYVVRGIKRVDLFARSGSLDDELNYLFAGSLRRWI